MEVVVPSQRADPHNGRSETSTPRRHFAAPNGTLGDRVTALRETRRGTPTPRRLRYVGCGGKMEPERELSDRPGFTGATRGGF